MTAPPQLNKSTSHSLLWLTPYTSLIGIQHIAPLNATGLKNNNSQMGMNIRYQIE